MIAITSICLICVTSLCVGQKLVENGEFKDDSLTEDHFPLYYTLLMQSFRSLYMTLSTITNLSQTFEKKVDGKVCVQKPSDLDKLLVSNLKQRLKAENLLQCGSNLSSDANWHEGTEETLEQIKRLFLALSTGKNKQTADNSSDIRRNTTVRNTTNVDSPLQKVKPSVIAVVSTEQATQRTLNSDTGIVGSESPLNHDSILRSTPSIQKSPNSLTSYVESSPVRVQPTATRSTQPSTSASRDTSNHVDSAVGEGFSNFLNRVQSSNDRVSKRRKRRSIDLVGERNMTADENEILANLGISQIGAKAWKEHCVGKRNVTAVNTRNMCSTCQYTIQLPQNYYPQFHRHLTCGSKTDSSCFSNQGICSKTVQTTHILVLHPLSPLIVDEIQLHLTTCCTCEIVAGNLFDDFV